MSSTAGIREAIAPDSSRTPWDEAGRTELIVQGSSLEQLMEGVLVALISAIAPQSIPEPFTPKSTRIRGEGSDAGTISIDLAHALFAEIDALGVIPVEAAVDGLVRSERGYVGWASVSVVNLRADQKIEFPGVEIVDQRNDRNDFQVRLRLSR